ncbi:MAG: glycosyltransferase [Acidobacteria bacterium]|nr:glycosyltransferase [Acidobacteriota bacterium]
MFFTVLAVLALLQGLVALREGCRYLAYVRKELEAPVPEFSPRAAVIVPFKGPQEGFEATLHAILSQDYPAYEVVFVAESSRDLAWELVARILKSGHHPPSRLLEAGTTDSSSQKIHNLRCALQKIDPAVEALIFLDADAQPSAGWLRGLAAPLAEPGVGASTGYRWYLPASGSWPSLIQSLWNASIVTALGPHKRNFAWGGSMSILRETFERAAIAEKWHGSVSDDFVLTREVKAMDLSVRFVPRCLVPSVGVTSWRDLLEFTTRQMVITRVYAPGLWGFGLVANLLFCAALTASILILIDRIIRSESIFWPAVTGMLIYLAGLIRSELRLRAVRLMVPEVAQTTLRVRLAYDLLYPVAHFLFLYNFCRSAFSRRISWRGIQYLLRSPSETIVLSLDSQASPIDNPGSEI